MLPRNCKSKRCSLRKEYKGEASCCSIRAFWRGKLEILVPRSKLCPPPSSSVIVLIHNASGDGAPRWLYWRPWSRRAYGLLRGAGATRAISVHAQRKGYVRAQAQARKRALTEPEFDLGVLAARTETINVCCLSLPVRGTSLWQPVQTKTPEVFLIHWQSINNHSQPFNIQQPLTFHCQHKEINYFPNTRMV